VLGLVIAAYLQLAGCIPDMQADFFCASDVTAPYGESPPGLVTAQTQKVVETYLGLNGDWSGQMECPDGFPNSGPLTVSIRTDTLDQMRVVVGADMTKPGIDCHREGTVLAGGQITLVGAAIGELSGQAAALHAQLGHKGRVDFVFDSSYDPGLAAVGGAVFIGADFSLLNIIQFAQQPVHVSGDYYTQEGYDCGLTLGSRL